MQNVLIVDDQQIPRMILNEFVETIGPDVTGKSFETPATALGWAGRHPVAMALVDYRMPGMDGIVFTRRLHELPGKRDVPVVIFTALDDPDKAIRYQALSAGAMDFLPKPVDYTEWRYRVRNLLNLARCRHQESLSRELRQTLCRITSAAHGRNPIRLANLSRHIAEQLQLSADDCELIRQAAPLNDLGHFLVAAHLLWSPSSLKQEERTEIQGHTLAGFQLLQQGDSALFHRAAQIALSHHEQFDGKGYPHGFGGRDIPLEARIVSVADFVDALLSDRPYHKAWSVERVFRFVKAYRGTRFDPDCVDAFFAQLDRKLLAGNGPLPNPIAG